MHKEFEDLLERYLIFFFINDSEIVLEHSRKELLRFFAL